MPSNTNTNASKKAYRSHVACPSAATLLLLTIYMTYVYILKNKNVEKKQIYTHIAIGYPVSGLSLSL